MQLKQQTSGHNDVSFLGVIYAYMTPRCAHLMKWSVYTISYKNKHLIHLSLLYRLNLPIHSCVTNVIKCPTKQHGVQMCYTLDLCAEMVKHVCCLAQIHSAGNTFRPVPRVNAGPLLNTLQSLSQSPYTSSEPGLALHRRSSSGSSSETSVHGINSRSTTDLEPLSPLSPQVMEIENNSTLATFLTSLDLVDCVQLLHKEKLDLEALALCDEKDLISIGLPLGPRKKILHAIQRRREVMTNPGRLNDSEL